jgi:uncharacterized protein
MLAVDVNVLVYAHRSDVDRHDEWRAWLEDAIGGPEPVGLIDQVLTGFVRIVTHPRVFVEPTPLAAALDFVDRLRVAPATMRTVGGERSVGIFDQLCRTTDARGNHVPDAYLAAVAIDAGATWLSADRGFARYPQLRWRHPLDDHGSPH